MRHNDSGVGSAFVRYYVFPTIVLFALAVVVLWVVR